MRNKIKVIVLLFLTYSSFSFAQDDEQRGNRDRGHRPPSISQIFDELDVDKDGNISETEVRGPLSRDFKKIDLNNDGLISKEELEKAPKPKRRERREE